MILNDFIKYITALHQKIAYYIFINFIKFDFLWPCHRDTTKIAVQINDVYFITTLQPLESVIRIIPLFLGLALISIGF